VPGRIEIDAECRTRLDVGLAGTDGEHGGLARIEVWHVEVEV